MTSEELYIKMRVADLEKENAELKAELARVGALPCKVGDTVYFICKLPVMKKYMIEEQEVTEENLYFMCYAKQIGEVFSTYEAAETEAILKGL